MYEESIDILLLDIIVIAIVIYSLSPPSNGNNLNNAMSFVCKEPLNSFLFPCP